MCRFDDELAPSSTVNECRSKVHYTQDASLFNLVIVGG